MGRVISSGGVAFEIRGVQEATLRSQKIRMGMPTGARLVRGFIPYRGCAANRRGDGLARRTGRPRYVKTIHPAPTGSTYEDLRGRYAVVTASPSSGANGEIR